MKPVLLMSLLLACSLLVPVVHAQTETPAEPPELCSDRGVDNLARVLEETAAALRDDPAAAAQRLTVVSAGIASYRARCESNLIFTSEAYGLKTVTDAIIFPDGAYRLIIESTGSAQLELTPIGGDCGDTFTFTDSAGGRNETVSLMEGCVAILDFDADTDYVVTYEPIVVQGANSSD
ncbi:MAG: hypothetical protein SF123_05880 [Chloroflexota bacterium]|nr:hypothetical protein [Chloroflexota bacterium]